MGLEKLASKQYCVGRSIDRLHKTHTKGRTDAAREDRRCGRANRSVTATSSATGSSSTPRSTARASRRCCCCRPGRSCTRGTGRCRSPTLRGIAAWSPSTGAATAAPTGRQSPRHTARPSSPPTPWPSWTPPAPSGRCWSSCRWAPPGRWSSARSTPSGWRGSSSSPRPCRWAARVPPGSRTRSPSGWTRPRGGPSTTSTTGASTTGSSWSSSSRRCSPSRTPPSRSRTPWAGGWRPTRRH